METESELLSLSRRWDSIEESADWREFIKPYLEDMREDAEQALVACNNPDTRAVLQGNIAAIREMMKVPQTLREMLRIENDMKAEELVDGPRRRTGRRYSGR